MKIAMFGATGFTGRSVVERALEEGHEVRALVRDPSRVTVRHERLELVRGDALDAADIDQLLEGTDVVIHCLGVGGKGDGKPTTLVSDSVALVVDAMRARKLTRLVCMSNVGAGGSGPWLFNRVLLPLFFRWLQPLIEDKDRMEAMLAATDLDWVAARFPNIVEGSAKPTRTDTDGRTISMRITTASAADFMLAQAAAARIEMRTPSVSN